MTAESISAVRPPDSLAAGRTAFALIALPALAVFAFALLSPTVFFCLGHQLADPTRPDSGF